MFWKKYRVFHKGGKFKLQSFIIFRWVTIGEYDERIRAETIKNGLIRDCGK
jgi:hypothetical protein